MASILRSSKFVRYIAGFAKNIVVNTPREFDGQLVNSTQCICGVIPRNFAAQSPALTDQNLDTSLRRIDQDVRRSGRISRRDIEEVLEEIRNARSATSSQSLLVIRCCGNLVPEELPEIRTKLVQEIWNTLNKLKVPMDVSHYNALLRVYLENEHPFSPTDFLAELEKKGIEPNRVTYQRLIARYCQDGDIEGATKILEFMREKQMSVNENVFNALIVGHSKTGDMDSAQGILNVMAQAGLEPSADTYTTLLSGYALKGDIDKVMQTVEECEAKEIFLLDKDYLDIVYSLAISGHIEHIPQVLSKLRKSVGYNQDAVNIILRLINKGQEEAAVLILKTMPRSQNKEDNTPLPTGLFFIKQLVKVNRPIDKIISLCDRFEKEGMYDRALLLATECSLQLGNIELVYPLIEQLHKKGIEVRQHFFWPLFAANTGNNDDVVAILRKMHDFGLVPTGDTLRDYVIPSLKGKSSEILRLLREGDIPIGTAASSLVTILLQNGEIEEAAAIASRVPAYYNPELIRRSLTNAFVNTNDLSSYITILRTIYENADRVVQMKSNEDNVEGTVDKEKIMGSLVLDLANNTQFFLSNVQQILEELLIYGLGIATPQAEKIEAKLGENMTEEISNLLGKLTSGDLTNVPLEKKPLSYVPTHMMNIPQLERLIQNLEAKNQEVKGLKRQLLTLYHRSKDLEKTEKLVEELKQQQFVFTNGVYIQLIDLYAHHENLEKALEYYEKIKTQGDIKIDDAKIIKLAELFVKKGKLDEAIEILENSPRDLTQSDDRNFAYNASVWRFLNYLADQGQVQEMDKIFDVLTKNAYIEPTNVILGPIIKVHLLRNELDQALEKFEWCVTQYKATPWKKELACKLIQAEDAEKLQKLTDLSTVVHGEVNSLYDLVFAFVECGRIRQARKILETPGLQNRQQKFNSICERYQQEGLIQPLEGLKDATKDLNHIDRSDIYYQLLLSYIKQDDTEKALGLWTQMQEEDLAPNDQFLISLGNFLKQKGQNVPFVVPQEVHTSTVLVQPPKNTVTTSFRMHLKVDNLDKALDIKNRSKEKFPTADLSILIEKLIHANRVPEATQVAIELLDRGNIPMNRVFRFLMNKLAALGDVQTLNTIGSKLSQEHKKIVSYDNRICHANLVAGNAEVYLDDLEKKIESADDEVLQNLADEFPRGGAYGILQNYPDLIDKYESVSIKYAKRGIMAPVNVLWTHYFTKGNEGKAEQLWNEYLTDSPRIMFQKVVQHAREQLDENLVKKLIEHLNKSKVTSGALGNAYSCLLDILVINDKNEEVVSTLENAVRTLPIQFLNRTALLRAKDVFKKLQKPFPYEIPPKKNNPEFVAE